MGGPLFPEFPERKFCLPMSSLISSTFLTHFLIFPLTLPKVYRTWRALRPELCGSGGAAQIVEGVHDAGRDLRLQLEGELGQSQADRGVQDLQLNLPAAQ